MAEETNGANRLAGEPLVLRCATKDDLDAILWIIESLPDDLGGNYKYPFRCQHPDDFSKWTRREYEEYMEQPEKWVSLVVAAPVAENGMVTRKPIAIGIWNVAVEMESIGGDKGIHERKDMNLERHAASIATHVRGFEKHSKKYGKEQLILWILLTHPDFRQRGADTMLCNWGLEESVKRGGWMLTLHASQMGKTFYEHLGYKQGGSEVAQVSGEKEFVEIWCMEKQP